MKKRALKTGIAIVLVSMFSLQSCIGSFSLTNRVLTWNKQVSNKFVNELVFFAFWILPVYEVTSIADLLVLNSIEFWSGNTPMEAGTKVIDTENGQYMIASSESGYNLTSPDGVTLCFEFNKDDQSWSFSKDGGEKIVFLKYLDENNVQIVGNNGEFIDVELTQQGVDGYYNSLLSPFMASL